MGNTNSKRNQPSKPLHLDILFDSFKCVDRTTLEKYRLVCRQWNGFIHSRPNSFQQRYTFSSLTIGHFSSTPAEATVQNNCCCNYNDALKALAHSLHGRLISQGDSSYCLIRVELRFFNNNNNDIIQLTIPNRLNSTTAFHYLHLLKHLNGCLIEEVLISPNILLSSVLPFTTIHCCHFINTSCILILPKLQQLTDAGFKPQIVKCNIGDTPLGLAIPAIIHYGQLPFLMSLDVCYSNWNKFDSAIQYIHMIDVSSTISSIKIYLVGGGGWKAQIMASLDDQFEAINSQEEGEFVYKCINRQSGREYRVVVDLIKEKVAEVTIKL